MLPKLLEDKNRQVQDPSVGCPLLHKYKEYAIEAVVANLCNMVSDDGQLSYSSGIGLKTVFGELPTCSGGALELSSSGCELGALFITEDLLSHVSFILLPCHLSVQGALLPQLASLSRLAACKRSITAICFLVMGWRYGFFVKLMDTLLVEATTKLPTYPGTSSRQMRHRMGDHLELLVPLMEMSG